MNDSRLGGGPTRARSVGLRLACLRLLLQLQAGAGSLTRLLPAAQAQVAEREQAQLQAWAYGFIRHSDELAGIVDQLLEKPLKKKDADVYLLMQLGLFQLQYTPLSAHAAVDETVKVVKALKKPWARGLVNAVLRNYQRRGDELRAALDERQLLNHPAWLLSRLQQDWPDQWQTICAENNAQAPMTLRVNRQRSTRAAYQAELLAQGLSAETIDGADDALQLASPVPVDRLPGFDQGRVSVQDAAAQLAAGYLCRLVPAGGRLIDACAAPGGKTAHALETGHFREIVALDQDGERLQRLAETLQRLQSTDAGVVRWQVADAVDTGHWWDGQMHDAVLLDAPCSGTGVIRRHPDIKWLRRDSDIAPLVSIQAQLLDRLWQTLAPGGLLLYATCSILRCENDEQVDAFLARTPDAEAAEPRRRILPGENGMDGFFYAPLRKRVS